MSISAKAVIRVIIEGEWIWVERGTFTVMPLEYLDENGNTLNPSRDPQMAYFFVSTNGDPYFGPLTAIKLAKLDTQLLEETGTTPTARTGAHELGTGTGETFGGELGSDREAREAEAGGDAAPRKAPSVPLFAGDEVDDDGAAVDDVADDAVEEVEEIDPDEREPVGRKRSGGLF